MLQITARKARRQGVVQHYEEWSSKAQEVARSKAYPSLEDIYWQILSSEDTSIPLDKKGIYFLQKCRKQRSLSHAKFAHLHICNNGLEIHRYLGNYIVPTLVECGSMDDAQQVFNRLVYRNEHSWTSLILGYIQCGQSKHALSLYKKMQDDSVDPSEYTLVALLKACGRLKNIETGRQIHIEILQKGLERNLYVGNTLVDMYAKCGSHLEAREVFDKLPIRDVVSWNALIAGYAEHGHGQDAISCFEQMQVDGITASAVTFASVLKACGTIKAIDSGIKIHMEIKKLGFHTDPYIGNTLVDMYCKCGSLLEAQVVFDELPVQDVVAWNSLIAGYAEHGPGEEALKCFEQMEQDGVSPDAVTFVCGLKACGRIRAIDKGRKIHDETVRRGFERDIIVGNTLVTMYSKCGLLTEAQKVFDKLPVRDVISWAALISGYAEHGPGQEAVRCFEQMKLEGISPNPATFVCSLKACGSIGAIDKGRELHTEVIQMGFDKDLFVGNSLVDMYAKCGSPSEAQEVFNILPVHDVVAWNTIIAGYAECGAGLEALKLFDRMQLEGVSVNIVTFGCVLKACGSIRAMDKGRYIHKEIKEKGYGRDLFVCNSLVNMYIKCGSLLDAHEVLDNLPVRDVMLWTTLIAGYSGHGHDQEVLKCFECMQLECISPNIAAFTYILKACSRLGAIEKGRQVHAAIEDKKYGNYLSVANSLLDMYVKCGLLSEARQIFCKLPVRDVVTWNILIAGHAEHDLAQEVVNCFEQMKLEAVSPNIATFVCCLKACGRLGAIDKGREIHMDIMQTGFGKDLFLNNALIDMYGKCGSLSEAREVFDKIPKRDVVSWNTLITGYAEHGSSQDVLTCYEQMELEGISPSAVTFIFLLKACSSVGAIHKGREIWSDIEQKGFDKDPFVCNTLVDMYAKCGLLLEAHDTFTKLPVRDIVSWNALIAGYVEHGPFQEALRCFDQMQLDGTFANAATFASLLKACGKMGAIDKGQQIHAEIAQKGFAECISISNTLVDMYAKCGSLIEAREVFDKMQVRDVVSYDAMINGYGMNHEGNMAFQCFEDMQLQGLKPNAITFTCLLTACSHSSLVLKGHEYYKIMRLDYGIMPTIDHNTCMVDLYARSGKLHDAIIFLETNVCPPSTRVWTALLSACKTYGEAE